MLHYCVHRLNYYIVYYIFMFDNSRRVFFFFFFLKVIVGGFELKRNNCLNVWFDLIAFKQ